MNTAGKIAISVVGVGAVGAGIYFIYKKFFSEEIGTNANVPFNPKDTSTYSQAAKDQAAAQVAAVAPTSKATAPSLDTRIGADNLIRIGDAINAGKTNVSTPVTKTTTTNTTTPRTGTNLLGIAGKLL